MRRRAVLARLSGLVLFALAPAFVPVTAQAQLAGTGPVVTQQRTLAGLAFRHVLMPEDTHEALSFAWRDGSGIALPGKEALPSLATALMMEGPKGLTRSAMIEELRDLQAGLGLSAGTNYTVGALSAPHPKFMAAAEILARVVADPALPEDKLAEAQRNRAVASRQGVENAETLALWLLQRLTLGDGPYWRTGGADPAIYSRITKADIEAWRRDVLARDNLVLVAVGPMEAAEVGHALDRIFASLPASSQQRDAPKPVLRSTGNLVVLEKAVVQTAIAVGGPTALTVTPNLPRAELAVDVLSRGFSSRLMRAVRERLGAAYGVSASLAAVDRDSRMLAIRTPVANDKGKAALAAIREEYATYVTEGATDEEVEPLKTVRITQHRERLQRSTTVAGALLGAALAGFPDDYLMTFEARIRSYTRAAVNDDIFMRLPKPPLTAVMVAPSAAGLGADCVIKALAEIARCE